MRYIYIDKYGYGKPYTHIHPLKQHYVKHLAENVPSGTRYVYLFGSALLPSCRQDSDIDVALVGNIDYAHGFRAMKLPGCEYDIITFKTMDEIKEGAAQSPQSVERSILEEGLLIYAKE